MQVALKHIFLLRVILVGAVSIRLAIFRNLSIQLQKTRVHASA